MASGLQFYFNIFILCTLAAKAFVKNTSYDPNTIINAMIAGI